MKRILITSTSAMAFHFFVPYIKEMANDGYEIECACSHIDDYEGRLRDALTGSYQIPIHTVSLKRSPFRPVNLKGYLEMKKIIGKGNYDLILTNEPVMGVVTRLVARTFRRQGGRVIYIAHGFHFYKGAPLVNWLLYYPVEKWLSRYTDALVTINKEDYALANLKMKAVKRVYQIPGIGVDTSKFFSPAIDRGSKRNELGIPQDAIVLISVGEINKNKNHQIIIKAVSKIKSNNLFYVICGQGPLKERLIKLCKKLKIEGRVSFLGFRTDIADLLHMSDIFIFPSFREGLPIAPIEAMLSGLPVISSNIRGPNDYSENGITGYTCSPANIDEFKNAIVNLMQNYDLRTRMAKHNKDDALRFDIKCSIEQMKKIIGDVLNG